MEAKFANLDIKVSMKTDIKMIPEKISYTSYPGSKINGQLLIRDDDNYTVNLGEQFYLSSSLKKSIYRVAVTSQLSITTKIVDYYEDISGNYFADKIIEGQVKEFKGALIAPILFEINNSSEVAPGSYPVTFSIYKSNALESENLIWQQTINIEVIDFKPADNLSTSFKTDIWQQPSNLARQYNVNLWSEEHFKLIEKLMAKLAKLNQHAVSVIIGEVPWCGWGSFLVKDYSANLYEYSIVKVVEDGGKLSCDFSALDRYLDLAEQYHMADQIDLFGILGVWELPYFPRPVVNNYPENVTIRVYNIKKGIYRFITDGDEMKWYINELFNHFKFLGVWDKVYIMADEPKNIQESISNFKKSALLLTDIAPGKLHFKVAIDKPKVLENISELVTDPLLSYYCATQYRRDIKVPNKNISFYVCNYPTFPNTYLYSELWEARLLGPMAYLLDVNGLTRWAANCWPDNARQDIRFNTDNLPTGDVCLYYPGDNGDILESLRTKQIEKGIEDWYLIQEANQYQPKEVRKIVMNFLNTDNLKELMLNSHISNMDAYNINGTSFEIIRSKLIEIIKENKLFSTGAL